MSEERPGPPAKRMRGDFDVTRSLSGWRRVAYQFARLLVKGTCSTLFRAEVHHRELVPTAGAYVLAPTHRSGWDIPLASLVTRRTSSRGTRPPVDASTIGSPTTTTTRGRCSPRRP